MKKLNIKKALVVAYIIAGTGGILYLIFSTLPKLVPVLIIASRIGTNMSFNISYASNNKLFPTVFLATTFGIVNLISHIISIGAPMFAEIKDPLPFLAFIVCVALGSFATIFLKELTEK
jgi:hypothetical protein